MEYVIFSNLQIIFFCVYSSVDIFGLIKIQYSLTMILTKLSSLELSVGEATSKTIRSGSSSPSGILSGSTGRGKVAKKYIK